MCAADMNSGGFVKHTKLCVCWTGAVLFPNKYEKDNRVVVVYSINGTLQSQADKYIKMKWENKQEVQPSWWD